MVTYTTKLPAYTPVVNIRTSLNQIMNSLKSIILLFIFVFLYFVYRWMFSLLLPSVYLRLEIYLNSVHILATVIGKKSISQ